MSASRRDQRRRITLNHKDFILLTILAFFAFGLASATVRAQTDSDQTPLVRFVQGQTSLEATGVSSQISVRVQGPLASVRVDQWFVNPGSGVMDAHYTFPLSDQAVMTDLRMISNDREIRARVKRRDVARNEFAGARDLGQTASLIEPVARSGLITSQISNIPPGQMVRTQLSYVQPVQYSDGEFVLRIPMTYRPRYALPMTTHSDDTFASGAMIDQAVLRVDETEWLPRSIHQASQSRPVRISNPVELDLVLNPGVPVDSLQSRYHDIQIETSDHSHRVHFERGAVSADRDFELRWRPSDSAQPQSSLFQERVGDHSYLMMTLHPPTFDTPLRQPRSLTFVIDVSGSMAGQSLLQARESLLMAVGSLTEIDQFNVLAFASEVTELFTEPMPVNHQTLGDAIAFVDRLQAEGGTRIDQALLASLSQPLSQRHVNQVIFLTDGSVDREDQLFAIIDQHLGDRRLHTIGIGSAPNQYFMRKAARIGRGSSILISDISEVSERVDQLLNRIERPMIRDLTLDWPATIELAGAALSDVHDGEALTILARVDSSNHVGSISGRYGNAIWQQSLSGYDAPQGTGIATLWAQARIAELLDDLALGGERELIRAAVTALALEHHLLSPWTSMLAVDVSQRQSPELSRHTRIFEANRPANEPLEPIDADQLLSVYSDDTVLLPQTATPALMNGLLGLCLVLVGWALLQRMRDPS